MTQYSFARVHEATNSIIFANLPMPPTSNNQYASLRRGNKIIRVPSTGLRLFKDAMQKYALTCMQQIHASRQLTQSWIRDKKPLEITCVFFFHKSRLISKKNDFKKLDVSNRVKAAHDSIADMLGIDDCRFFRVVAEKALCHESLPESFCFEIIASDQLVV
jgi:hypothetical protein